MKLMGTLKKAGGLLEKKSVIITVIALNCAVISLLAGYLFFLKGNNQNAGNSGRITEERQAACSDKDAEMANIYASLLEGMDFDLGDRVVFSFGSEGKYAGFFDAGHKNVKDYRYGFKIEGDSILLNIYNKEKTQMVSYGMSFDADGDVLLKHPDSKKTIRIEF